MTEKELFDRLVVVFGEINLLTEDVAELKSEAKEQGMEKDRIGHIVNAAKAKAACKLDVKEEQAKGFLEVIGELT